MQTPQPYVKRTDYRVGYQIVQPGEYVEVFNKLENAHYTTDHARGKNVILTGTVGEQWVTSEDKLYSTYDCDGNGWAYPKPTAGIVWMRPAEGQEAVNTSWGDTLWANLPYNDLGEPVPHGAGDMVAYSDAGGYPNENDCWIVNGQVFADTYMPAG